MAETKTLTSEPIRLEDVRLSFPRLSKPKAFQEGQEPRFEASALLDPSKPAHAAKISELKGLVKKLATEKWGSIPPDLKLFMFRGDTKPYDGYAGMIAIAAHNTVRPTVVNRARQPVAEGDKQFPFAGCFVNMTITLWVQSNQWGKRINANLRAIQFVRDGDAFGVQPVDAEEEFEALEDAPLGKTVAGGAALDDDIPL